MRILFDIVHPAQVHFFKQAIWKHQLRGDHVRVTARKKDITIDLLKALGIKYTCISTMGGNLPAMGLELICRTLKLFILALNFKPQVMVARVGHSIGIVGKLLHIPTVVYDDMEHAKLQAAIGMTFATHICTGLGYYRNFGKRQIQFEAPPVLSYLSPKYFTPNPEVLKKAGLDPQEKIIFFRIVSWKATHDVGHQGTSLSELNSAIESLSKYGRVVISSEGQLPKGLKQYANPVPVEKIHDLLALAHICIIEGGTMAEEAAVLGVPSICIDKFNLGYLIALEKKYGLVFRPTSMTEAIRIAESILTNPNAKNVFIKKKQKLLEESEDVVNFMIDTVDRVC